MKMSLQSCEAIKKAMPTVLTFVSAIGVVATVVLTAKATPKALEKIEEAEQIKIAGNGEKLTRLETIQVCWKTYAPATITGIATIGCVFGANILNRRQQASLMSAYALLDKSFRNYKGAVRNVFGDEGHKKVLENIAAEKPNPPGIFGSVTGMPFDFGITDEQKHLFYDTLSDRYFEARISDVLLAELHTNRNFSINGGEVPVHYFYDFLGLETPEELKNLSWFVSDYYYFIDFTHDKILIDDGPGNDPVECYVIDMPYPPTPEPLEDM